MYSLPRSIAALTLAWSALCASVCLAEDKAIPSFRAGIIGLDTSHVIAFTKILNDPEAAADVAGCRVVCAYPQGSADIESSSSRIPGYTKQLQDAGVQIVDSIDALLKQVDVVFLETNDGRLHLDQALQVFKAKKPVFIDKPIAANLADAIAIYRAAEHYKTPVFSSSSLRFSEGVLAAKSGSVGKVLGCDTYGPCSLEKTHVDLTWYGIHGCEALFAVMGTGCQSVSRTQTPDFDMVVGTWEDGRIGSFRGIRRGANGYGGTVYGTDKIQPLGGYGGYRPLLVEVIKFFRDKKVPVSAAETIELFAFMEAADESKRQGGAPVTIASVMAKAEKEAQARLAGKLD